jgi:hypothetical protein
MQVGDLIKFLEDGGWTDDINGKTAVVIAIRSETGRRLGWQEWDCLVNGKVESSFTLRPDDPGYLKRYGVEVISKVCNLTGLMV